MNRIIFSLVFFMTSHIGFAQLSRTKESAQFNFWIGKWELFTNGSKMGESKVDTLLCSYSSYNQDIFLTHIPYLIFE